MAQLTKSTRMQTTAASLMAAAAILQSCGLFQKRKSEANVRVVVTLPPED